MIVTVYRYDQAYSLAADEVLRIASVQQFSPAWAEPADKAPPISGQLGFALGQPVLAQEPFSLLGTGRVGGVDLPEDEADLLPPRHLVLLRACDGDIRHAVWADGLDWGPR